MQKITLTVLLAAAATSFASCATPAENNGARVVNTNASKSIAPAPTLEALMALERQANEAYAKGNGKFFEDLLSDKFVILGPDGSRIDKATTIKMIAGVKCDIQSMQLTEPAMSMIDADTYALSYKANWDGTCDGPNGKPMKVPSPIRSASIWVRSDNKWQSVFHGENLIVDPKNVAKTAPAPPAKKEKAAEPKNDDKAMGNANTAPNTAATKMDTADANTDDLVREELALWEAWKEHDAKKLDALMAKDVSFVNIFGTYFPTRADAMKDWTGSNCQIKSVSVSDGIATSLSPTVEMLTRKGTAIGTCGGQEIGGTAIWGVSIFVKEGDSWKFAFGMNLSAM